MNKSLKMYHIIEWQSLELGKLLKVTPVMRFLSNKIFKFWDRSLQWKDLDLGKQSTIQKTFKLGMKGKVMRLFHYQQ